MDLIITPLTRAQTAAMPKFNNVEAYLGDSLVDRISNFGNELINRFENANAALQKAKEEFKELDSLKETDINNPNYQAPTTSKSALKPALIGASVVLGSYIIYKQFIKG